MTKQKGYGYGVKHHFQQYSYRGGQFYWLRKPEYPGKTTELSQVTDKLLSHNVVSSTPRHELGSNSPL